MSKSVPALCGEEGRYHRRAGAGPACCCAALALFLFGLVTDAAPDGASAGQVLRPRDGALAVGREGNMFVVVTAGYRVQTDISPEAALELARNMQLIGEAYYRILPRSAPPAEPLRVVVFRDRRDYLEAAGPPGENTVGLYRPAARSLLACAADAGMDEVLGILRHEGFHQFADRSFGLLVPPWANEGLAEYFHYARMQQGALVAGELPPRALRSVQQAIRAGKAIPLAQITALDLEAWNRQRADRLEEASLAYDQSWLLVHFLVEGEGGRRQPLLRRYLDLIAKGVAGREALAAVFGPDPAGAALENAWRTYVLQLQVSPRYLCRENLEFLGTLLLQLSRGKHYTPEEFRRALLAQRLGGWRLGDAKGRLIHSERPDEVKSLFLCPLDARPGATSSYEFAYAAPAGAGLPAITCRHHPGILIVVRFQFDKPSQKWRVEVAEE